MKKKRIIIIGLILVAGSLAVWRLWPTDEVGEEGVLTTFGNVDIREVTLGFRVSGKLKKMMKEEGEPVATGDILAELDAAPYRERLLQAEAERDARKARLTMLRNGSRLENIEQGEARLAQAVANLKNANVTLEREVALQKNQASTAQKLDDVSNAQAQAVAAVEVAQADLRLLKAGFREEEISLAEAELAGAEAKVMEIRIQLEDCQLLAPSEGIVRTRVLETGAIAGAGAPVYVLSLTERPWIRAYISESQLGRIAPGMAVEVTTDTRPDTPYTGHIGFISPTAEFTPKSIQTEALRTNLVYRFRVIIDKADDALRQGMPATVRITTKTDTP